MYPYILLATLLQSPAPNALIPAATTAAASTNQEQLQKFAPFSGMDIRQKKVFSLERLTGKLVLVCFWSPWNDNSMRELIVMSRLYSQFHKQGLDAVGISVTLDVAAVQSALDDFGILFPVLVDIKKIAKREGVASEDLPYTFLLNEKHEVIAAGLAPAEFETIINRLMRK